MYGVSCRFLLAIALLAGAVGVLVYIRTHAVVLASGSVVTVCAMAVFLLILYARVLARHKEAGRSPGGVMAEKLNLATSVSQEILDVLGAIVVNFGALENTLALAISVLLGGTAENNEKHQILTAHMSLKNLTWAFESLYRDRFGTQNEAELETLRPRVFAAEQKRNTLIHSLWVGGENGAAMRLKLVARGEYKLTSEQHTKPQLIEVANELAQLTYDLTRFTITSVFGE